MNRTKKNIYITAGVLAATAVAIVLRSIVLIKNFDLFYGYYERDAVLPVVLNVFCVLLAIAIVAVSLFALPKKESKKPMTSRLCRIVAILPVTILAIRAFSILGELPQIIIYHGFGKYLLSPLFSALLAILAAVFFITVCSGFKHKTLAAISGVVTIFFFLVELFKVYNDMTVPMNSPLKVFFYFAALSSALFVLAELRILWGDKIHGKTSAMSQYLTVLLTGVYSIPNLVFSAVQGGSRADLFSGFAFFFFAVFVLATVRVITLAFSEDMPAEDVAAQEFEPEVTEETAEETEISAEPEPETEEAAQTDQEQKEN